MGTLEQDASPLGCQGTSALHQHHLLQGTALQPCACCLWDKDPTRAPELPRGVFNSDRSLHGPQGSDALSRMPISKHCLLQSGMERQCDAEAKCIFL